MAMEGLKVITLLIIRFFGITDLIYFTYFNSSRSNVPFKKLTIKTYRKECIRGLHTNNLGPFIKLKPYFITGFADAEGCFSIDIQKLKTGLRVQAVFLIVLHQKDIAILELIKSYFEVGNITKHGKDTHQFRVTSLRNLTNIIIPHFDKYPIITQKKVDFIFFQRNC